MRIKSITDVVTNSSTEVFVLCREDLPSWTTEGEESGCISVSDFIDVFTSEEEALCEIMGWSPEDTGATLIHTRWGTDYWGCWDPEVWDQWIENHRGEIDEKVRDLLWVEIEDHYYWDSYESDVERARDVALWKESRH